MLDGNLSEILKVLDVPSNLLQDCTITKAFRGYSEKEVAFLICAKFVCFDHRNKFTRGNGSETENGEDRSAIDGDKILIPLIHPPLHQHFTLVLE